MMKMIMLTLTMNFLTILINKKMFNLIINLMLILFIKLMTLNNFNIIWIKINYKLGMDHFSMILIILSIWIMYLSLFANNTFLKNKFKLNFLNIMLLMLTTLILCFSSINFMMFYIFFEISLIPIMLIIMGWGYQIDRIQASMYMLFYTLMGSLPLLILIMMLYMKFNNLMFNILMMTFNHNYFNNMMIYFLMILAFLIKLPMYLVHLWLPKAHVEAPISGSMILAGIMLKLGAYGMYRTIFIFKNISMSFNYLMILFSLMGSLMASLICLNQNDLKIIVAYSSIVHMSILLASIFTLKYLSIIGSLMMMISHGLCSAGMFFLVNINYERINSRSLSMNKNFLNFTPSLSLWWFLFCSSNFSAPPSMNLFSEILLFSSMIHWKYLTIPMIMFISFFSTCYSLLIYAFTQYGNNNFSMFNFKLVNCREFMILIMLWIPLNLMFLNFMYFFY